MRKSVLRAATVALVFAGAASTPLLANADALDNAIKGRQGFFQMLSINFGPLVGMAKGEVEYDAALAATNAENLKTLGMLKLGNIFPEGSDKESKAGATHALPAIWADMPDFQAKAADFAAAAEAIASAAPNGLDALRPAVGALGKTCGACHDNYRADD